ncbi:peptidoglycan hydrolase [Escherichia phage A73]|uniref:Peptidoglycan hydrolase n=2 Tax=Vequintavirinae TaxID=1911928 RepID=A0AAF0AQ11_9CAUD|nr:putative endolysin [Escherichia phage UPEC06]UZZ64399.1 peptidoglycan hydrolase [Escherichia phage A5-4]WBF77741.1 peptidoglycan hydrolase [Escherichia phage A73]WBF77993.1 peptidoglycan hydrolase [Escherichia phage W70]
MGFVLGKRSIERLKGVHPDLVEVVKLAIKKSTIDFTVGEGLRTIETQRKYVAEGKSKTMNSRHLTGHAVDLWPLVNGSVTWDWKYYYPMAEAVKDAAKELNIPIEWGGDWTSFKDGPHFQLPHKLYP